MNDTNLQSHNNILSNSGLTHHKSGCTCGAHSECGFCCTQIEHLCVYSSDTVILSDINLHIHCGELTAIIGRNGAGKTTFFKALLGEVPHEGKIRFMPNACQNVTKPRFGYVPQSMHIPSGAPVSVQDTVLSCVTKRSVLCTPRKKEKEIAERVLAKTSAEHLINRRMCDLSGGELQRVMLALALEPLPQILLLDEPVSGIDKKGLNDFYELVSTLRKKNDISILLISHDFDLVKRYADRVVLFENCKSTVGFPDEMFKSTQFKSAFMQKI